MMIRLTKRQKSNWFHNHWIRMYLLLVLLFPQSMMKKCRLDYFIELDRTARLWDLEKGVEKLMLGLHPNNITCVRFIPNSSLAFTVSLSTVRIWDLRIAKNVYTLHSSGLGTEGELATTNTGRQNTVPISETVITAAEVDPLGRFLFTTFSGDVRVWDLEKFAAYGRLTGASHSPRSEVSCLSVTNDPSLQVYTGSRDHYVKIYDVKSDGQGIYEATHELSPPHYDSITCVLPYGDSVFTASKDTNIMRFSTKDWKRDHLELKAHDRAVNDMCILEMERPLLATVCKAGNVKLWDITSTRRIRTVGEISQAHDDQINAITTDSGLVYTASNDTMVGVWRLSPFGS
ncbi:hypothetical protein AB6A40_005928 [Gnathostoma spinigerum]|uniref:Uncharacterized protein n=1 Tax=Gnathostoma spinigerum TaxID=75299 RepID=A0ABD6EPJ1_9BILA